LKWRSLIFSLYGVMVVVFGLASLLTFFWEKSLTPVFLTAFSIFFLDVVRIFYQRPRISISKIEYYEFEESVRICTKIENRGRSVARYVKPLLTIENENLTQLVNAEYSDLNKKGFHVQKTDPLVRFVARIVGDFSAHLLLKLRKTTFVGRYLRSMLVLALITGVTVMPPI